MTVLTKTSLTVLCPNCGQEVKVNVSLDHVALEEGLWLLSQVRTTTTEHTCPEEGQQHGGRLRHAEGNARLTHRWAKPRRRNLER